METEKDKIKRKFERIDRAPVVNPRYEGKTVLEIAQALLRSKKAQAKAAWQPIPRKRSGCA